MIQDKLKQENLHIWVSVTSKFWAFFHSYIFTKVNTVWRCKCIRWMSKHTNTCTARVYNAVYMAGNCWCHLVIFVQSLKLSDIYQNVLFHFVSNRLHPQNHFQLRHSQHFTLSTVICQTRNCVCDNKRKTLVLRITVRRTRTEDTPSENKPHQCFSTSFPCRISCIYIHTHTERLQLFGGKSDMYKHTALRELGVEVCIFSWVLFYQQCQTQIYRSLHTHVTI